MTNAFGITGRHSRTLMENITAQPTNIKRSAEYLLLSLLLSSLLYSTTTDWEMVVVGNSQWQGVIEICLSLLRPKAL